MAELLTLGSPVKIAYEGQANTNELSDAEQAKLDNLPNDTNAELVAVAANTATAISSAVSAHEAAPTSHAADVSQIEAEAGTEVARRWWSPVRVWQAAETAIANWASANLGSAAAEDTSAFDPAGAAFTVQTNLDAHDSNTANPHSVTAAQAGADLAGAAASVQANLTTHETDVNPHSVTAAQVSADPVGTAASAVSSHEAAGDPHTQYLTEAEGMLADYGEQSQDLGNVSTTLTVDISDGQSVLATLTGDVSTVSFQNPTGHDATSFALLLTTGGFDVTNWSGAVAGWFGVVPDLSSGGTHGFGFELVDGNWYGTHKGQVV